MKRVSLLLIIVMLSIGILPAVAQGGPGTRDFPIRDFGACINLPDFANESEPDAFNTVFDVPGLFSINFAEYLMPLPAPPANSNAIYNAMIALLDTVNASDYTRVNFAHPEYISAAVEFTLEGQRMFGMIYRNQNDKVFFLFADKVDGFDMLAIGRAIFAADQGCGRLNLAPVVDQSAPASYATGGNYRPTDQSAAPNQSTLPTQNTRGTVYDSWPDFCSLACSHLTCDQIYQCGGHPKRDQDRDGRACESQCW